MSLCRHVLLLLFILGVLGCQSEKTNTVTPDSKSADSPKLIDVSLALNWYPEAEHGGFYAALVHGFFKEEGLDVKIRPGGDGVRVIEDVASGKMDFGVDNADKLLILRQQQADVVVVMSPIQDSPRCIMVHKSSGMTRLEDLEKTAKYTLSMNPAQPFAQFLTKKLKLDSVQIVPYSAGAALFLDNPNAGQQAYSFSEPFVAQKQGGDPLCLMLSDIGFNTYTSVLLTRRETIDQQPDIVRKMTRASVRGWKKYLAEPDETNKYIHEQNPTMGLDILAFGVKALHPLCLPKGFDETRLGEMSPERWQTLLSQMVEIGKIKPDTIKAEDAFTLKFLPEN